METSDRFDCLYAVLCPRNDNEQLVGLELPGGQQVPLIMPTLAMALSLREQLEELAQEHGLTYKVVRFTKREDIVTIGGTPTAAAPTEPISSERFFAVPPGGFMAKRVVEM